MFIIIFTSYSSYFPSLYGNGDNKTSFVGVMEGMNKTDE